MSRLANALFSRTQRQLLGLLYTQPERSFYTKEIIRLTGMGVATIKRELDRMLEVGILNMTRIGNQHHYQANPDCPIYHELLSIVNKTIGITDILNQALSSNAHDISWAFVFGSVASNQEISSSDIDLMVIGDIGFVETVNALHPIQDKIGREINPKLYRKDAWLELVERKDAFIKDVLSKPRMDVIGDGLDQKQSKRPI
ncbi:MAG: nucleotidyltransferase domain-containing protein [Candidatus Thiodiazotropha endolucinida]|nr:nucleotidyltransferase domain-containing protein [Candidatus Thiodiazotropha endolucinida]